MIEDMISAEMKTNINHMVMAGIIIVKEILIVGLIIMKIMFIENKKIFIEQQFEIFAPKFYAKFSVNNI